MRRLLFITLIFPVLVYAQKDTLRAKSKMEIELGRSGTLFKKTFMNIGKVNYLSIDVLDIADISKKTSIRGLRFEMAEIGLYSSGSALNFLDLDEVDGLIKAFGAIKDILTQPLPENYTEYVFTSKSGFQCSCFNDKKKWVVTTKVDQYNRNSLMVWRDVDDVNKLYELIVKAKESL